MFSFRSSKHFTICCILSCKMIRLNKQSFGAKICKDICPGTLFVPRSEHTLSENCDKSHFVFVVLILTSALCRPLETFTSNLYRDHIFEKSFIIAAIITTTCCFSYVSCSLCCIFTTTIFYPLLTQVSSCCSSLEASFHFTPNCHDYFIHMVSVLCARHTLPTGAVNQQ